MAAGLPSCSLLMLLSEDQHSFVTAAHTPSSLRKSIPSSSVCMCPHLHTTQKNLWSTPNCHTHRAFRASSEARRPGMQTILKMAGQHHRFVTGAPCPNRRKLGCCCQHRGGRGAREFFAIRQIRTPKHAQEQMHTRNEGVALHCGGHGENNWPTGPLAVVAGGLLQRLWVAGRTK